MEILVRQNFTEADAKRADLTRSEFRKSKATSNVSSLLNIIDLQQSIILCDTDARKFNARAHRYKRHPNEKLFRVLGNCDVCQQRTLGFFLIHESEWIEERKKEEKFKRALEYATIVSG
jgi:hypothetical protein